MIEVKVKAILVVTGSVSATLAARVIRLQAIPAASASSSSVTSNTPFSVVMHPDCPVSEPVDRDFGSDENNTREPSGISEGAGSCQGFRHAKIVVVVDATRSDSGFGHVCPTARARACVVVSAFGVIRLGPRTELRTRFPSVLREGRLGCRVISSPTSGRMV